MAKRLDADIRELAEEMQARRNEAGKRVRCGEIMHMRFMEPEALRRRAGENLDQITDGLGPEDLTALADCANYTLAFLAVRQAEKGAAG